MGKKYRPGSLETHFGQVNGKRMREVKGADEGTWLQGEAELRRVHFVFQKIRHKHV